MTASATRPLACRPSQLENCISSGTLQVSALRPERPACADSLVLPGRHLQSMWSRLCDSHDLCFFRMLERIVRICLTSLSRTDHRNCHALLHLPIAIYGAVGCGPDAVVGRRGSHRMRSVWNIQLGHIGFNDAQV